MVLLLESQQHHSEGRISWNGLNNWHIDCMHLSMCDVRNGSHIGLLSGIMYEWPLFCHRGSIELVVLKDGVIEGPQSAGPTSTDGLVWR